MEKLKSCSIDIGSTPNISVHGTDSTKNVKIQLPHFPMMDELLFHVDEKKDETCEHKVVTGTDVTTYELSRVIQTPPLTMAKHDDRQVHI
jgi:hypothetical protein